ncbi:MAG TPA: zinc-dependent metalloprotease family protein [Phycisphaerae bacterium]|jgi:hypothetical protein
MAFDVAVVSASGVTAHRIVPVRFSRAVTGFSDQTAPDMDDHGFTIPAQFATAHGPVTGVMKTKTIRVKVIRDRIEPTANLYVTSADASIASVDFPAADTALSPNDIPADAGAGTPLRQADCIFIKGTSTAATSVETIISVRFGSSTGPILAQLCVRVYPILAINVQIHNVSINGTAAGVTLAQGRDLFRRVNHIYAQTGIRFDVVNNLLTETLTGFARAGFVTLTNVNDAQNIELQTVLNSNANANALNAYFVPGYFDNQQPAGSQINQTLGIAFSRDSATANPPTAGPPVFPGCQAGITVFLGNDVPLVAHTAAHEIGHSLRLEHYGRGNGANIRQDLWAHRCLMHNFVDLVAAALPVDYGTFASSGAASAGELLMTKGRAGIPQSEQINEMRRAMLNNSFMPVARP